MRPNYLIKPCVPVETLERNARYARSLGLPFVRKAERPPLAVVGGGPSIEKHVRTLRDWPGDVWACGSPFHWCLKNGIESTFFCADPQTETVELAKGARKAILSTTIAPAVVHACEEVELFDLFNDAEQSNNGVTTATCALHLSIMMGYRDVTFFGCESSYSEGKTHSYKQDLGARRIQVECGGESFTTDPSLLMQAEMMAAVMELSPMFKEQSGGLLRAMLKCPEYDVECA